MYDQRKALFRSVAACGVKRIARHKTGGETTITALNASIELHLGRACAGVRYELTIRVVAFDFDGGFEKYEAYMGAWWASQQYTSDMGAEIVPPWIAFPGSTGTGFKQGIEQS